MYGELSVLESILIMIKLAVFRLVIKQGQFYKNIQKKGNTSGLFSALSINQADMIYCINFQILNRRIATRQKNLMQNPLNQKK